MDNVNSSRRQCHRPGTRRLVQLYSALLYNAHLRGFVDGEIYVGKAKYACVPGFNCYSCPGAVGACPLGALQNALASSGHQAGWYILGMLSLFGAILGRTICGWLCPLGMIQELLHGVPTPKIRKSCVTRVLSRLKYVLLAVFVAALPLWYGLKNDLPLPAFCKYICPAGTLEGAIALLSNPANADKLSMLGILFTRKFLIMLAVGLLCAALLWFNFLDPSVKKRPADKPTPTAETLVPERENETESLGEHAPPDGESFETISFESSAPIGYEVGRQLADFTTPTFDGGEFHLADTRGKIVFLNLWGTYCTPCVQELPDFEALLEEHAGEIAMLAVHSPMTGEVEPEDFVRDRGWDQWLLPFALDDEDEETIFTIVNGGTALPQTIVLNRRGEVIYNRVGSVTPEMLEALLRQADAGDSAGSALSAVS